MILIPTGSSYVRVPIERPSAPESGVWFVAEGVAPTRVGIAMATLPARVSVTTDSSTLFPADRTLVTARVEGPQGPIAGASLTWRSTKGSLEDAGATTDEHGRATATFVASEAGDGSVQVTVEAFGLRSMTGSAPTPVLSPTQARPVAAPQVFGAPVWTLLVTVLALMLGYGVLSLRRGGSLAPA